jgi:hypothetical protein
MWKLERFQIAGKSTDFCRTFEVLSEKATATNPETFDSTKNK